MILRLAEKTIPVCCLGSANRIFQLCRKSLTLYAATVLSLFTGHFKIAVTTPKPDIPKLR
jgi:hypothetical protein